MTRTLKSVLIASVLVAMLAGCDPFGAQGQGGGGEGQQQRSSRSRANGETQPVGGKAPAQPSDPIATRQVENDGATLRVDITGLKRNDRLVTLNWNITVVKGGGSCGDCWELVTRLSADQSATTYDVSGVRLVDTVNSKRYLVAHSGGSGQEVGRCVCSATKTTGLRPGGGVSLFATFTAPPPDVTKLNVDLLDLGVFDNVPIS